ncbi:receptor-like protein kinase HERK 1, partial [Tanacetum coccineum]
MMLSRYRHKNLVSLIGFCDEDDEKILVYEYEFNGSLEKYLSSEELTWSQRLKICIGAARGLEYLHNPLGTQQRVLHRDVKCANFLLDHNWEAKISDFGLSRIGPANQEFTFLVSTVVGTLGYCDPLYAETGILTKESDVYSFGVVLFEVLCGRFCIGKHDDEHRLLIPLAQRSYEKGTLDDIIFRDGRTPTMADESYESGKPMEYEEILQMVDREHPLVYTNKRELISLLSSGILVDWGRRWFSLSKNEHNCELISASEFSFEDPDMIEWIPHPRSRFSEVAKIESAQLENFEIEETGVSGQSRLVGLTYKLKEVSESTKHRFSGEYIENNGIVLEAANSCLLRRCEAALEVLPADMEAQAKAELNKKAHSAMILCLGNKVFREVIGETTAAGVWSKLETLYMTKSLANKLYLKKKLYTFYMPAGRKISEHIDEFNKIVLDLANIE